MFLLVLLQIFSAQIDSAITRFNQSDYEGAYRIAHNIAIDSTQGLEYYEIQELRAYISIRVRKFQEADSLFQIAFQAENKNLLRKAYTNYAELQHMQFNFKDRLLYLQKAYNIEATNQLIRIIAKHHFQIEADYELAETWLNRHTAPADAKDSSGYFSTLAQLAEAKRQYGQAIDYYRRAKMSAQEANLFNYELFAAEGEYRANRIISKTRQENMINILSWVILSLVIFVIYTLKEIYGTPNLGKNTGRH